MSYIDCKSALSSLLLDRTLKVVALSGPWGVGKTHLWKGIQEDSLDPLVRNAMYCSLFGVTSIRDLKLKLAQAAVLQSSGGGTVKEMLGNVVSVGKKAATALHPSFEALDEIGFMAVPMLLRGKLIVIDDIERKHDSLHVNEVLGFVEECAQRFGCKILLILNVEKLTDDFIWRQFREKVVDEEQRLVMSPSEATSIALSLHKSRGLTPAAAPELPNQFRAAIEACQITNIRVISKLERLVRRILGEAGKLDTAIHDRVVPSVVLLGAIHHRSLDNAPDFEFVVNYRSTFSETADRVVASDRDAEAPHAGREGWILLMDRLGIKSCGLFEKAIVRYLESGQIDARSIQEAIRAFSENRSALLVRVAAEKFLEDRKWNVKKPDRSFLHDLEIIRAGVQWLDATLLDAIYYQAGEVSGGQAVADELIDAWVSAFEQRYSSGEEAVPAPGHTLLHEKILDVVRRMRAISLSRNSLSGLCSRANEGKELSESDQALLSSVTTEDWTQALRRATGQELKLIVLQSLEFHRARYEDKKYEYGRVAHCFVEACCLIVNAPHSSGSDDRQNARLAAVLEGQFKSSGLIQLLEDNHSEAFSDPAEAE